MESFYKMLNIQLGQLIGLAVGGWAYWRGYITDKNRDALVQIVLQLFMPALIIHSFANITSEMMVLGGQVLIASTIIYGVQAIGAGFLYRDFSDKNQALFHYATLVNNAGLGGQPLSYMMFGDPGSLLAAIYLIPHRLFMWSYGLKILQQGNSEHGNIWLKILKNPSVIAVGIGILRVLLDIQFPEFIDLGLNNMGRAVSPMAAVIIGSIMATIKPQQLLERGVLRYTVIRLFIIPLIVLMITRLLALDSTLAGVLVIMTAMPAGTTTALLAEQYGLDENLAAKIMFVTTSLSIITVPLMVALI